MMIDPPSGWMYGFPKPYNPRPYQSTEDWLMENGYPEDQVLYWLEHGEHVPCRYWGE